MLLEKEYQLFLNRKLWLRRLNVNLIEDSVIAVEETICFLICTLPHEQPDLTFH